MKKEGVIFLLVISLILINSVYAVTYEFAGYSKEYTKSSTSKIGTGVCKLSEASGGYGSNATCNVVQKLTSGVWANTATPTCAVAPLDSSSYRAECQLPVVCTTHASTKCYNTDVYWYNSCGVMEDIKTDCGAGACIKPAVGDAYCGCGNDCTTEGSKQCKDGIPNVIQTCVSNYDTDTCLEWGEDSTCNYGQTCQLTLGQAECKWDGSTAYCGNGKKDASLDEECDQSSAPVACTSIPNMGFTSGTATCIQPGQSNECKWNLVNCVLSYSCTGATPANAVLCTGDDTGLTANTAKTLVASCTTTKCEYRCNSNSGYVKSGDSCVIPCISSYKNDCDSTDGCNPARTSNSPYNLCDLTSNVACGTETACTDGYDNNCNGESDYDSQDGRHGDANCAVGVTSISAPANAYVNNDIIVSCTSSAANVNSISASLGGSLCSYASWSGNTVYFNCNTGSTSGTKTALCIVDTAKSYKSGTDKSASVNVQNVPCATYTSSSTCPTATCDWCAQCSNPFSTKQADACVTKDTCPTRVCWKGQCGAACDDTNGGCSAGYACNSNCACISTCSASNCGACTSLGSTECKNKGCDWDDLAGSATYNTCISKTADCGTPCNPWTENCDIDEIKRACCTVSGGTGETLVPIVIM